MEDMMYFIYGSTVDTDESIKNIFKSGISNLTNSIFTSFMYVDLTDDKIEDFCKDYGYEATYIIRIPRIYLMPRTSKGVLKQIPLPIWKKEINRYSISNELVYGVYVKKDKMFIGNAAYSELHDPIGLSFDKKQVELFDAYKIERWQKFAKLRDKLDYEKLRVLDVTHNIWPSATSQYYDYFNKKKM